MNFTSIPSEKELNQLLKKTFTSSFRPGYITVNDFVLPERYHELGKTINEFEVLDTDLWICGFPKTGTTWISEIAWLILHDLDYEGAKVEDYIRIKLLDGSLLFDTRSPTKVFGIQNFKMDSFGSIKAEKSPRSIKSHLPFSLLPKEIQNGTKKPKIICTARNPMDTCVSYYYQCQNLEGFTGTFEEFCKLFLFDKINYAPYSKHVLSFWEQREKTNILFLTYEEMKDDLAGVIQKVALFMGKPLTKENSIRLQEHVSFDSMKKNPAVNKEIVYKMIEAGGQATTPFVRSGKVGGYRSTMSSELIDQFRYLMAKRFEGSGLNLLDE